MNIVRIALVCSCVASLAACDGRRRGSGPGETDSGVVDIGVIELDDSGIRLADSGPRDTGVRATIAGRWDGTWESSIGVNGALSAMLEQRGEAVTGSVSYTGNPCVTSGTLTGTFLDGKLDADVSFDPVGFATFDAMLDEPDIDGTFQASAGLCGSDTGTFTMRRTL